MADGSKKTICDDAVNMLIEAHDGNVALLYLWLSRKDGFDPELAARELCLTRRQVEEAYEKLCRMELYAQARVQKAPELSPREELPEYSAKDVTQRAQQDPVFTAVLNEAQRKLGRVLSTADIKTLFGIYDYLALPPDVIFMLLTYCIDAFAERYGSGRLPSMRSIEKEAYSWANKEILTIEQAEELIKSAAERRSDVGKLKTLLGIGGRELTATETKYINSWLDMGTPAELIEVAYDRTVTNTGSLKWNYMNKILQSWHDKGIRTVADIGEKDAYKPRTKPDAPVHSSATSDELGRLRSIYKKVKDG